MNPVFCCQKFVTPVYNGSFVLIWTDFSPMVHGNCYVWCLSIRSPLILRCIAWLYRSKIRYWSPTTISDESKEHMCNIKVSFKHIRNVTVIHKSALVDICDVIHRHELQTVGISIAFMSCQVNAFVLQDPALVFHIHWCWPLLYLQQTTFSLSCFV